MIICSGLLYHMDASSIIPLLKNMRKNLNEEGISIIDTNIVKEASLSYQVDNDLTLYGSEWTEHTGNFDPKEKSKQGWSSWKNSKAFWLTERSLVNSLVKSGYEGVFKPLYPYHEWGHQTRDIWIALPSMITKVNYHYVKNLMIGQYPTQACNEDTNSSQRFSGSV